MLTSNGISRLKSVCTRHIIMLSLALNHVFEAIFMIFLSCLDEVEKLNLAVLFSVSSMYQFVVRSVDGEPLGQ